MVLFTRLPQPLLVPFLTSLASRWCLNKHRQAFHVSFLTAHLSIKLRFLLLRWRLLGAKRSLSQTGVANARARHDKCGSALVRAESHLELESLFLLDLARVGDSFLRNQ
jgi:hypothetical protein